MKRFIEGLDRSQTTLLPDCIDDYVDKDNLGRAVDTFVDMLDLAALGFDVEPEATGRPGYYQGTMLKLLPIRLSQPGAVIAILGVSGLIKAMRA